MCHSELPFICVSIIIIVVSIRRLFTELDNGCWVYIYCCNDLVMFCTSEYIGWRIFKVVFSSTVPTTSNGQSSFKVLCHLDSGVPLTRNILSSLTIYRSGLSWGILNTIIIFYCLKPQYNIKVKASGGVGKIKRVHLGYHCIALYY